MIKFLLYITVSLFSLGQIGRLSFLNQQINIYAYEIVLGILLFSLFIKYRLQPLKQAYKQFKSIFVFSGILLFSLLISLSSYNITQNIVALLYLLRLFFYFLVFVYLSQLKHNKIASPSARNDTGDIQTYIVGKQPDLKSFRNFVSLDTRSREIRNRIINDK